MILFLFIIHCGYMYEKKLLYLCTLKTFFNGIIERKTRYNLNKLSGRHNDIVRFTAQLTQSLTVDKTKLRKSIFFILIFGIMC